MRVFEAIHLVPAEEGFTAILQQELGRGILVGMQLAVRCDLCHPFVLASVVVGREDVQEES